MSHLRAFQRHLGRRAAQAIPFALALLLPWFVPPRGADAAEPFFDAHVHLNFLPRQLELMTAHGLERAVIFWGGNSDNAAMAAAAAAHPGRFFPFVSVSPERRAYRGMWERQDPALLDVLERELRRGVFLGIGELNIVHFPARRFPENEYSPSHPLVAGIMELARRFSLPVMFHCEVTYLKEFAALLGRFPDVPVIWAHGGYADYFLTRRMVERNANLTIELSMRMVEGHPRSPDYWIMRDAATVWPEWLRLIEAYPGRFVVGTDAAQRSRAGDDAKVESVLVLLRQLTPATRGCVAAENLERLLKLRQAGGCG